MKIASSTVAMSAYSAYSKTKTAEATTKTTYHGDGFENTTYFGTKTSSYASQYRSSAAVYSTGSSANGIDEQSIYDHASLMTDKKTEDEEPLSESSGNAGIALSQGTSTASIGGSLNSLISSDDPKITMLRSMLKLLERVTGKKFKLEDSLGAMSELQGGASFSSIKGIKINQNNSGFLSQQQIASSAVKGYWTKQTVEEGYEEGTQSMSFSSKGTAVTADGRSIDFNMTLDMSSSFASAYSITGEEQAFKTLDPLVINMKNSSAEISDAHFMFDLNCDGKEEEISQLGAGSGFLALDKNGDGAINNGSELFGTRTGDGFAELAKYDEDNNGWIDENDSVFAKLKVWSKEADGTDKLIAIGEAGVGAIFLGNQRADYTLTDSEGNEGAYVKSTGMFLKEDGGSGTIQHVDFRA